LDYDGTLADLQNQPQEAIPDSGFVELIDMLNTQSQLEIFMITGRTRHEMDNWFDALGLNMVAEDGFYVKYKGDGQWSQIDALADLSWKEQLHGALLHYTDMTPGSMIEEKSASLVWHYRQVEHDFGTWKAHQLISELRESLSNMPVTINHGGKRVEVTSMLINKGMALQQIRGNVPFDHVLCAGDDITDETMFRAATDQDLSIKIGPGETAARFRVASPSAFRRLLAGALRDLR
jgi:trehalose 6-phosphate synthase/phosphatase